MRIVSKTLRCSCFSNARYTLYNFGLSQTKEDQWWWLLYVYLKCNMKWHIAQHGMELKLKTTYLELHLQNCHAEVGLLTLAMTASISSSFSAHKNHNCQSVFILLYLFTTSACGWCFIPLYYLDLCLSLRLNRWHHRTVYIQGTICTQVYLLDPCCTVWFVMKSHCL